MVKSQRQHINNMCPFCFSTFKSENNCVKRCNSCNANYSEVITEGTETNTKIISFTTENYKIQKYITSNDSIIRIQNDNVDKWLNNDFKILEFNLEKIDKKIKNLMLIM